MFEAVDFVIDSEAFQLMTWRLATDFEVLCDRFNMDSRFCYDFRIDFDICLLLTAPHVGNFEVNFHIDSKLNSE